LTARRKYGKINALIINESVGAKMNVGRVSNADNLIKFSAANQIAPSPANTPILRIKPYVDRQKNIENGPAPDGKTAKTPQDGKAAATQPNGITAKTPSMDSESSAGAADKILYSKDGDMANISGKAQDLFRNMAAEAANGSEQTDPGQKALDLPFGVQLNLPSPFIDYKALPNVNKGADNNALPSVSEGPDSKAKTNLLEGLKPAGRCETCANRKYVDKSDDPSVSYQTPTTLNASTSAIAVAAHESEHVNNEQANARTDDRKVVQQSVTFTYAVCPECGRLYVAGGNTKTVSVG